MLREQTDLRSGQNADVERSRTALQIERSTARTLYLFEKVKTLQRRSSSLHTTIADAEETLPSLACPREITHNCCMWMKRRIVPRPGLLPARRPFSWHQRYTATTPACRQPDRQGSPRSRRDGRLPSASASRS